MLKLVRHNGWDREKRILLITGDGKTLQDDLLQFIGMGIDHDVCCIGRSIKLYPGEVTHYTDVDADAGKWVAENLEKNNPGKGSPVKHTLGDVPWFDFGWDVESCQIPSEDVLWHGSTALFAVYFAIELGYERIILAGCPMDSKGHWYFKDQNYGPKWTFEGYQAWFEFAATPEAANRVRSMSGYTETLLGGPSIEWMIS